MKKITLIGLICLSVMGTAHADEEFMDINLESDGTFSIPSGPCVSHKFTYSGVQGSDDDEFLHVNWDGGVGFECDNERCRDGFMVTLFPGHKWKGDRIMETRTYKCNLGFNDKWEILTNGYADPDVKRMGFRYCTDDDGEVSSKYPAREKPYTFSYYDGTENMIPYLLKGEKGVDAEQYDRATGLSAVCRSIPGNGWADIKIESCNVREGYVLCNGKCVHYYKDLFPNFTDEQHKQLVELSVNKDIYKTQVAKGQLTSETDVAVLAELVPYIQEYAGCKEAK